MKTNKPYNIPSMEDLVRFWYENLTEPGPVIDLVYFSSWVGDLPTSIAAKYWIEELHSIWEDGGDINEE